MEFNINSIGVVRSPLTDLEIAPRQGDEGAPDAWLELAPHLSGGLLGMSVGDEIIVLTWLHQSRRDVVQVHPRGDQTRPLTGVFATRSPHRPNPIGMHQVVVKEIEQHRIKVGPLEVIDGTPLVDIKPVLGPPASR
jgi:tRNA-Thr(GGU) m(6)t(6)A37 methyltransferase TsaA